MWQDVSFGEFHFHASNRHSRTHSRTHARARAYAHAHTHRLSQMTDVRTGQPGSRFVDSSADSEKVGGHNYIGHNYRPIARRWEERARNIRENSSGRSETGCSDGCTGREPR